MLCDAAGSLGVVVDIAAVEEAIPAMYRYYEQLFKEDNSIWGDDNRAINIWMLMYEYLCELVGIPEVGPEVAKIGYTAYLKAGSWELFDDVMPTLDALKSQGISLGIISNWDSSLQGIIDGMGIMPYFDTLICSAVVGLHKPQTEIFKLALDEMGVEKSETLYVGDHMDADIKGALKAGITPVLIDRHARFKDGEGYIRIQNLEEILKYL